MTSASTEPATGHPVAAVPERLFDDDAREQRWRARFTATRLSRPDWARDAPDRSLYTSNATGTVVAAGSYIVYRQVA